MYDLATASRMISSARSETEIDAIMAATLPRETRDATEDAAVAAAIADLAACVAEAQAVFDSNRARVRAAVAVLMPVQLSNAAAGAAIESAHFAFMRMAEAALD